MLATISWDQTLLSLLLAAAIATAAAYVAYRRAALVLRRQETLRELRARREALDSVVAALDSVREYLEDEAQDYPQREMVELERCALQAQVFYVRDLTLQKALRDITYPDRHREALRTIQRAIDGVEAEIAELE